jgi:hypothetical protein
MLSSSVSRVTATAEAADRSDEFKTRKEVLDLLRKSGTAPVNISVAPKGTDAVQAAIDQISAIGA